jgi:hypothetical protein
MTDPVFFVVERCAAGETAAVYRDLLPVRLTRKIPRDDRGQPCELPPIIYALRIDRLPDADRWLAMALDELYAQYLWLRDKGKLPTQNLADPPKKGEAAQLLFGHRENYGVSLSDARPPDPFPDPEDLVPRPTAGGFISMED